MDSAAATITLHARPSATRCPVCREPFSGSVLLRVRCPGCHVSQHETCLRELGRCATFACAAPPARRAPPGRPASARPRPDLRRPSSAGRLIGGAFAAALVLPAAWLGLVVLFCTYAFAPSRPTLVELGVPGLVVLSVVSSALGLVLGVAGVRRGRGRAGPVALGVASVLVNALPWALILYAWLA